MYRQDVGGTCPSGSKKYGKSACCCRNYCCWGGCSDAPEDCIANAPFPLEWLLDARGKYRVYRKCKSIAVAGYLYIILVTDNLLICPLQSSNTTSTVGPGETRDPTVLTTHHPVSKFRFHQLAQIGKIINNFGITHM